MPEPNVEQTDHQPQQVPSTYLILVPHYLAQTNIKTTGEPLLQIVVKDKPELAETEWKTQAISDYIQLKGAKTTPVQKVPGRIQAKPPNLVTSPQTQEITRTQLLNHESTQATNPKRKGQNLNRVNVHQSKGKAQSNQVHRVGNGRAQQVKR